MKLKADEYKTTRVSKRNQSPDYHHYHSGGFAVTRSLYIIYICILSNLKATHASWCMYRVV